MKIAIHQPNYLPWCGYFYKMALVDLFVILDDCAFTKSGVTHRVRIKAPHGSAWLTVPVGKRELPIVDLSPDVSQDWGARHWNLLRNGYANAAFWSDVAPWLKTLLRMRWERLVDLNLEGIRQIAGFLGINTPLQRTSALPESFKKSLGSGNARNLAICRYFAAHTYVSGEGARLYNEEDSFAAAGIELEYATFEHPVYPQVGGDFVAGLSAVDLLFNCGPESGNILLRRAAEKADGYEDGAYGPGGTVPDDSSGDRQSNPGGA